MASEVKPDVDTEEASPPSEPAEGQNGNSETADADVSALGDSTAPDPPKPWGLGRYGIPRPPDTPCDTAIAAKFEHFSNLRARGMSFNDSLMRNKSFRNPNILSKLVDFVDVDEYTSNMPKEIWNPRGLPEEAYARNIARRQKEKEEARDAAQKSRKPRSIAFTQAISSSSSNPKHNRHDGSSSGGSTYENSHGSRRKTLPGGEDRGRHRDSTSNSRYSKKTRRLSPYPRR